MKRYLRKKEGFTLIEIIVVLIIIAVLAAMLIPVIMDRIEQARISRAKSDVNAINTAIQTFNVDTGVWPRRGTTSSTQFTILVSGTDAKTYTVTNTDNPGTFPRHAGTLNNMAESANARSEKWNYFWVGTLNDQVLTENIQIGTNTAIGNINTTGATDASIASGSAIYTGNKIRWRGPYTAPIGNDPWGTKYIVNAVALGDVLTQTQTTAGKKTIYGWVLSAGQNRVLETEVTEPKLNTQSATSDIGAATDTTLDDIGTVAAATKKKITGMNIYGEPE